MATKQKASGSASKAAKAPAKKAVPASKKTVTKQAAAAKTPVKGSSKPALSSSDAKKPASKSKVAATSEKKPVKTASKAQTAVASAKKAASSASQIPEKAKSPGKATGLKSAQPAKPVSASGKAAKVIPEVVSETPVNVPVQKPAARPKAKEEKPTKPVPMPKITATTSRKYEPDFTRSILDQPSTVNTGPTMRYSDAELQEFRELITRKLESAKKELTFLSGLITRKDEMSGDESENRYMTMEDGSLSMEREQLNQMASRQIDFIEKLEKAIMRIENKTYGICRETGNLIDKARLRAVPHATLSIEAKMKRNRQNNS